MDRISLKSYAKVNLTLEVSGKRPDGYHDLDSVVQVIDISDSIEISKADSGVIELDVDVAHIPTGNENVAYKACEVFFEKSGLIGGAIVKLTKRIPVQAGLGGGSGNAAAVIAGLNALYGCRYSAQELSDIAALVGSDSPLFIYGGTLRMRGRGDVIEPLPDAPEMWMVVVQPDVGVSTAWAYNELDKNSNRETRASSNCAARAVRAGFKAGIIACMWNDFDPLVCNEYSDIMRVKEMLLHLGAETALLSGSGSAVFGIFPECKAAENAAIAARKQYKNVFVARSLARAESSLAGLNE